MNAHTPPPERCSRSARYKVKRLCGSSIPEVIESFVHDSVKHATLGEDACVEELMQLWQFVFQTTSVRQETLEKSWWRCLRWRKVSVSVRWGGWCVEEDGSRYRASRRWMTTWHQGGRRWVEKAGMAWEPCRNDNLDLMRTTVWTTVRRTEVEWMIQRNGAEWSLPVDWVCRCLMRRFSQISKCSRSLRFCQVTIYVDIWLDVFRVRFL